MITRSDLRVFKNKRKKPLLTYFDRPINTQNFTEANGRYFKYREAEKRLRGDLSIKYILSEGIGFRRVLVDGCEVTFLHGENFNRVLKGRLTNGVKGEVLPNVFPRKSKTPLHLSETVFFGGDGAA